MGDRLDVGYCDLVNGHDRDQRESQVADLVEQAVEFGLVHTCGAESGGAVALVGKARDIEPGRPSLIEVAPEADHVRPGLSLAANAGWCLAHRAARSMRLVAGAAWGAGSRWSRHREMPRPIRAP